ncbi:MAG: ester cyclase [Anaerolineaceae bacterium]|nr:ester cyclase [Anaerolineaceae bacterium]
MSENQNKYIALRYFKEIMTDGNLGTIYELLTPDFVFTLPTHPEPYVGPDGFKELVTMLHSCFPDFFIDAKDMVASGEMVVTRWRGGGTHLGAAIHTVAGDIPPSGRHFEIDGMSWHRIQNGKIVEVIGHEDTIGMFKQLGIMPSPRTTSTPAQNLAVAHRFIDELLNQGRFSIMDEIVTEDFEFRLPTQPTLSGRESLRGYIGYLRSAFSGLKFEVEREVANDNKVAIRWCITGKQIGEFNGVAPSGVEVEEFGIDLFEFWDGKIRSVNVVANQFGLTNQMMARRPEPRPMTPEENNAIAEKFFNSVWSMGDFSVLDTLISSDAIDHSTVGGKPKQEKGSGSFRAIVSMFRNAMPDIKLTIDDEVYAGDKVVHRWTLNGTDTGGVMGMPPSGKRLSFTGITTVRMADGKIVERWANVDELGLLQQLGVAPPPPAN